MTEIRNEDEAGFQLAGIREVQPDVQTKSRPRYGKKPWLSLIVLSVILLGCLCNGMIMTKDPTYMDLGNYSVAPNGEFWFGTDTMGRDIFSMIWYGGRISLLIGIVSTAISAVIAVIFGTLSALSPQWLDAVLMRFTEILLTIPSLLAVIFVQAILGQPGIWSVSFVIGITSWMSIAKVVRTEVRQLRCCEYVIAAKCMGGGFFHILRKHLMPNFYSAIMFMLVMNIRGAIVAESTLSFMGIGLPLEMISWGSMLSLSEKALLTGAWWMILIPGAFLAVTLLCITELANELRRTGSRKESNL